jgi:hypothetical protein
MTLTCKWGKDRTGALVMKWTEDEGPMPKPQPWRPAQEPSTRDHERRATGLVLSAMLPALLIPEAPAANMAPNARAQAAPAA